MGTEAKAMNWTCAQVEERLSEHLEGGLGPSERAAVEAHLGECERCAGLAFAVRAALDELRALPPAEPSPELFARIVARTLGPRPVRAAGWRQWLRPAVVPRFAFGLASILVTFAVLFHVVASPSSRASLSPVQLYRAADRRSHLGYARVAKFVNDLRLVYEIQSRLQPEAGAVEAPGPLPQPEKPAKKPSGPVNRLLSRPSFVGSAFLSSGAGAQAGSIFTGIERGQR